uniref:D-alanine-D-alanine ligase and related ATP-grasp enzymes-like protein n=1 Tax=Chlorobium chlorochromatii (strain CaD3) TaxID=340177 RepID=Q3AS15_CHLCH
MNNSVGFRIECKSTHIVSGYLLGMTQPSLVAQLQFGETISYKALIDRLVLCLSNYLPPQQLKELSFAQNDAQSFAKVIVLIVTGLQESVGLPVLGIAKVMNQSNKALKELEKPVYLFQLFFPSFEPQAAKLLLEWLLNTLNHLKEKQTALSETQHKALQQLFQKLRVMAPGGTNNIRFIRAAHTLGIPLLSLPGGVFQYGWGCNARWFDSSITDATPAIGVKLARNKLVTNALLKIGGLPVPEGRRVSSLEDALLYAKQLGYPVVIKPADLDQGAGVYADLRNSDEVREAFAHARKLSPTIMLERHSVGKVFRITVFRGEAVAVVERLPAGVLGDGVSTVQALVEKVNKDPRRSKTSFSLMKPIVIDNEAQMMLDREQMSLNTVPLAGQFIALRRAANVSTGGDVILLSPHEYDASYANLARRAAALLRLDVAAVDFIAHDIGKPWQQAFATVIEVNAQPQMGGVRTNLNKQLLASYVHGDGTIPAVMVLGADSATIVRQVRERYGNELSGLGSVSSDGVFIGNNAIGNGGKNIITEIQALIVDSTITALLFAGEHNNLLSQGLPLPFCHYLILSDCSSEVNDIARQLDIFHKHIKNEVWLVQGHVLQGHVERLFGQDKIRLFVSIMEIVTAIKQTFDVNIMSAKIN